MRKDNLFVSVFLPVFLLLTGILQSSFMQAQEETRLLRFPAVYDNQVVFTYAGDLYTVEKTGGIARKLTNDQGFEMFARFSPDGKNIAFTGEYDGNREVYLIPSNGGEPKRLTYTATLSRDDVSDRMGPNNIVMTWTPDGKNIIYRSRKQTFNDFTGQLFSVNINGGLSEELPLMTGSWCSYSPDGGQMAINRVFREFRTWKYYKGGMADDVWIFDIKSGTTTNITNNDAQDIFPMWYGDKIFFCSDRDRIMNIFCYNTKDKTTRKITNFDFYDVKFPSAGNKEIIFENGGYLYTLDPVTEQLTKLTIIIKDDMVAGRNKLKDASKNIGSIDMSPDGNRLAIVGRGDIYTVPVRSGITRNITQSSGAHDRNVKWSPDGKYLAYISDMDGEFEIYIQEQDGLNAPVKITSEADTYIFGLSWSPDSKKILYSDKMMRLRYINVETKEVTEIERNPYWEIRSYDWSPDSKWVAYSHQESNGFNTIMLYSLDKKEIYPVTDKWYSSNSPVFSNDGKYLFFTSNRDFNPTYSSTEWNHVYNNMTRMYFTILSKDTPNPLGYENDEVKILESSGSVQKDESNKKQQNNKDNIIKNNEKNIKVDTDGLNNRIVAVAGSPAYYNIIGYIEGKLYYVKINNEGRYLRMINLTSGKDKEKDTELGKNMNMSISSDNKKALISSEQKYYVIDLPSGKINLEKNIDLSDMKVYVDNYEEWTQIYHEAWRQMRDFFYVKNMHGVDWERMRDKYAVLLPYVKCKDDLNYLIGELIGELNVGHAYINGGDRSYPERISMGLLGAKLERDKSGYYRIETILKGENWRRELRSPLSEVGMNINEGDFIVAVNGKSTKEMDDIYESLINTADKEVILSISTEPNDKNKRDVIVVPVKEEGKLYYYTWVRNNIEKVDKATNGEVGYIHIPDMGVGGLNEFAKYFYPQLDKKALIIDDRGNGGGNVSPMILERLGREITRANMSRNQLVPSQTPTKMMLGPKVLLIDRYSASDGDLFPYGFRKHELGKIIGVRSWGGIVGIRGSLPFVDGTTLNRPEFTSFDSNGSGYIIEGYGVDPDIYIDNDPFQEYSGVDAQLDKAIEVILEELKNYKGLPDIPQDPVR
jgi:tricorn protease